MLELLIIGGFLLFGGLYSEGLKCAGAYSVWNFVRGGAYFRNFVLHKKILSTFVPHVWYTRWIWVPLSCVIEDTLGHELPQLDLTEASRGLAVNIQLMLPQTPIL